MGPHFSSKPGSGLLLCFWKGHSLSHIFIDPIFDLVQAIAISQAVEPEKALGSWWLQRWVLHPFTVCPAGLELIVHLLHGSDNPLLGGGRGNRPDDAALGGHAILFRFLLAVAFLALQGAPARTSQLPDTGSHPHPPLNPNNSITGAPQKRCACFSYLIGHRSGLDL